MVYLCSDCEMGLHKDCVISSWWCDCECNTGGFADCLTKSCTIVGGAALAVTGVVLTVGTVGLAAPIGGAMTGAGISSVSYSVGKVFSGERVNADGLVAECTIGAVVGVVTGGIGAAGEVLAANVAKQAGTEVLKQGAIKLGVRAAAGATAGVTAKAIDEIQQCASGNKEWSDYGKTLDANGNANGTAVSWLTSAGAGAIGAAGSHLTSNLTKAVPQGVFRSATRVGVSGATAATSDALAQTVNIAAGNQESYNIKQTVKSAMVSSAMTAGAEGVKNGVYKYHGGKDQLLEKKTIEKIAPKERRAEIATEKKNLENLDSTKHQAESKKAEALTKSDKDISNLKNKLTAINEKIKTSNDAVKNLPPNSDQRASEGAKLEKLKMDRIRNIAETKKIESQKLDLGPIDKKLTPNNAHHLTGDKLGQISSDINTSANTPNTGRGSERVTFDYHPNAPAGQKFIPAGYTSNHNYNAMPKQGEGIYYKYDDNLKQYQTLSGHYHLAKHASEPVNGKKEEEKKKKK